MIWPIDTCMPADVTLPPLLSPIDELWHVLMDLAQVLEIPWTLVGGQMVLLHALEHGHVPPQVSQDGDVVADIRAEPAGIRQVVEALETMGFSLESFSADGLAHRYVRKGKTVGDVKIDILAPEGLGQRADLTTTKPGRTVQMPGGSQALARTERVQVNHEGREGSVPRPSLLGAIVAKAAACSVPGDPARHLRDLALLCALVSDPFAMKAELVAKDRQRLRLASALEAPDHSAWLLVPESIRSNGRAAFGILCDTSG